MLTSAWLFPGQGSQYPQMGRHVWHESLARDVLSMAESISGLPLRSVIENGPEATLRRPEYLEPSVLALQASYVLLLQGRGMQPDVVAGYSLGEIGALYCAGCISLVDALTLASARGKILSRQAQPHAWQTRAICFRDEPSALPLDGVNNIFIAAYNSPREFTVTGEAASIQALERVLLRLGASVSPVAIDGPWHSILAAASARATAALLQSIELRPPLMPVCLATSGQFETNPELLRACLGSQIDHPVYWTEALATLWQSGVRSTLEIGPGRVLTSFVRNNWVRRDYQSHFIDRQGGRAIDFGTIKASLVSKERSWIQST